MEKVLRDRLYLPEAAFPSACPVYTKTVHAPDKVYLRKAPNGLPEGLF